MRFVCLFLFVLCLTACQAQSKLIWEENFEDESLNDMYWNYELGNGCPQLCGWGNNEPQWYTKTNHTLKNGFLYIKAKKENDRYTSTRITTKDKFEFRYGRVEARAKLPIGTGVWPAIWMLGANISEIGWPKCGEIDILEYVGREPDMVFNSLHTEDSHGETINTKKTRIPEIEEGFHVYAADWTPDKIDFYIDGELMYTFAPENKTMDVWPFDQDFYLILNLAVGGNFGGPDIDDTIFPQEFIVDYVRVYEN